MAGRCSRYGTILVVVVALIALVATVLPVPATAQQGERRQLDEARSRLRQLAAEITGAEAEADGAQSALEDADAKLREVEAVVNEVAAQVDHQRAAVAEAQERLDVVEAEAAELADAYAERITRLFKQGPELAFELLLAADGSQDALARTAMLQHVTQGDQIDLERLDAAEVAVSAERERLAAEQERLEQLLAEQEELLEEVAVLRQSRALEAAEAREQVRLLHGEQDNLEREEHRLERLIKERQEEERRRLAAAKRQRERERRQQQAQAATSKASARASVSASSASGYAWPLCARVTSEYGPRWGRMHSGIDLGASTGTPIGASKAGTVIYAGSQGGYGRLVLIDHGDGVVTAYAHMSKISVSSGSSVSQGKTIGLVGSTGNSTGPHLHFETRVSGSAVDPRQYLAGRPC